MRKVFAFMVLMGFLTSSVLAQEQAAENAAEPVAARSIKSESASPNLPLWEAGLFGGGLTQPAYPGADEQANLVLGLPYVIYRGEYLRVDRGTVGVRAIKTPRTEVDVGFAASLGSRAEDIQARHGMGDLGILIEFGPRIKINLGEVSENGSASRIQFSMRGVLDANDHLSYRGIAFEPQWVKDMRLTNGWIISSNLGAIFGNQELVDTFYRVTPSEATPTRPAYEARSGLIALRASLFLSRLISPEIRFFSYMRFDSIAGAANYSSPLVRRDSGWTVGFGFAWTLARSERSAKD